MNVATFLIACFQGLRYVITVHEDECQRLILELYTSGAKESMIILPQVLYYYGSMEEGKYAFFETKYAAASSNSIRIA
jgi:hypothetical protein